MTFLDELRRLRRSPLALYHEFDLAYDEQAQHLYVFVEGINDKEYLTPELRRRLKPLGDLRFYDCDGKSGVISALSHVAAKKPGAKRTIFFVDRDFDDFIPKKTPPAPNLYVTDHYSIENDLVCPELLRVLLTDYVHMQGDDAALDAILAQYERNLRYLLRSLRRATAFTIVGRRERVGVNLNNVSLDKLFSFDADVNLTRKASLLEKYAAMCGVDTKVVAAADVRVELRKLKVADHKRWLRGKFELWLFLKFANAVWANLTKMENPGKRRPKKTLDLTEGNVFQIFAGRLAYPQSLIQFLDAQGLAT